MSRAQGPLSKVKRKASKMNSTEITTERFTVSREGFVLAVYTGIVEADAASWENEPAQMAATRAESAIISLGGNLEAFGVTDLPYEIATMERGSDLRFGEVWISRA